MLRKKHRLREEKHPKLEISVTNPLSSPKSPTTPALSPSILRKISYPQAVDDEKMQEFTSSKQSTIQKMLTEATQQYQAMKGEYQKNPSEVNQSGVENQEKIIRRLKSQLSQTSPSSIGEGSLTLAPGKEVDRRSSCMETSASSLDDKEDSSSSSSGLPLHSYNLLPRNIKLGSKFKGRNAYLHNNSLSRSHSDSYKQRQEYLDSLKPSVSSDDFTSITENMAIGKRRQNSALSRSNSKSQGGTSDGNSDADQLHPLAEEHSASSLDVSNSTNSIHRNSQQSLAIMAFDEEDVSEDLERRINHFSKFEEIRNRPAHLAVFLHYLISNSDPAPLLFYLVTEGFSQGSVKDIRRWAYELYTTFLYEKAPLKFVSPANVLESIQDILSNKSEKDDKLCPLFEQLRTTSLNLSEELFGDFWNKLSLGLGSFYGEHELKYVDSHDSEINFIDKYLWRQFTMLISEENDRSSATCSALLTYFRSIGLPQASNFTDRFTPFVYKEKAKFSVFSKSSKKSTLQASDHSLQQHQYSQITNCNFCQSLIGGVGFQGYTCLKCEQNFHKGCLSSLKDRCTSKRVDRSKTTPNILRKKISVKDPAASLKQSELDQVDFTNLPRAISLMSLRDTSSRSHRFFKDKDRDFQKVNSIVPSSKISRDDSLKSMLDQTSNPTGIASKFQGETCRGGSPEPDDESKEFFDPVNKFFPNQHIPALLSNNSQIEISSDSDFEAETEVPQLESYISKDCLKKMKPKEKKRQNIVNELFHTERTHVRNMKVMHHLIFLRMNNEFPKDFVTLLFPNLEELIKVHDELNKDFKKKMRDSENSVVENFADVLVEHFTEEKSDRFKKVCAVFCEKQSQALEKLKAKQKKDQKLSSFLQETANNPLCRRFELKDLLPTAMQRLTKYPLFISNLLKYTSDAEECRKLELALAGSKSILEHVDRAVQRYENHLKLVDMQKRLDKKAIENATSALLTEYRNLDLTRHSLVFDGPLTWRINKDKLIHLHVVLLEDILLLLQKQDDRLVLKCQSMYIAAGKIDTRMTHSPIIKLVNLLIKSVATDSSAFFIVSQLTDPFPQIYELIASSNDEKEKWCRRITSALEAYKIINPDTWKAQSNPKPKTNSHRSSIPPTSPVEHSSIMQDNNTIHESEEEPQKESPPMKSKDSFQFSFESQLSNSTLTDLPQGDDIHHLQHDDDDDHDDHDDDNDDDDDVDSRLVKLKKMDKRINRLMRDKRTIVESLHGNKSAKDEGDQRGDEQEEAAHGLPSAETVQLIQSLLDEVLKLCEELESKDASHHQEIDQTITCNHQSEDGEVLSSQSLDVLPSQMNDDNSGDARSDLISSHSDSQLSIALQKLEDTLNDESLPNPFEVKSQVMNHEKVVGTEEGVGDEQIIQNTSTEPVTFTKSKLITTCLTLQMELLHLLESIPKESFMSHPINEDAAEEILDHDTQSSETLQLQPELDQDLRIIEDPSLTETKDCSEEENSENTDDRPHQNTTPQILENESSQSS